MISGHFHDFLFKKFFYCPNIPMPPIVDMLVVCKKSAREIMVRTRGATDPPASRDLREESQ
ncbi:uncharacterized protein Dmul_16380 [Desulfococcus multivorans]|nr:uncharacterized protein Dmul_16380 [Desulfococcus multivorans]